MNTSKNKKSISVTLTKGLMGMTQIQRRTLAGLGLTRRNPTVVLMNLLAIRGVVKKVITFLEVSES